ncbi:alpha/beta fold hydrolase [Pseudoalteromonas denitrificans]|uniref:Putative hydrolase, CocE/NonD family n=1 Tax=Pseudoalteromonas denitrificans DSM 6059 TaxID=1123010 RepID=A0A1I1KHM2_9GAMM|nr:alpha/beta fold hydrolase [Pseudoalteromonas denitrificans]SFC60307.1 putative hydrolase, CocE/NonD family [Pseudoalteromonas denitrificans DSM 6059]
MIKKQNRKYLYKFLFVFTVIFSTNQVHASSLIDLLKALVGHPVFKQSHLYTSNDDIIITAQDGINLHANIFVPTSGLDYYPTIIFINSWGLDEYEYLTEAAKFAEQGYIVLSYSTRGFGNSGGKIATAGEQDINDVSAVIDYLLANYPVDESNIGLAGVSYGSGISLLSAAHEPRINAVAAMSTWGSLTESLYGHQSPRLIWGALLTGLGYLTGDPSDEIAKNYIGLLKQERIAEITQWANQRSPLNYIDKLNQNAVPIYLSNNFGDNLFQPNSVLKLYKALTGPKLLDLNQGTHAVGEVLGMGKAQHHVWKNVHAWFDHWLKGEQNGITNKKPVEMEIKFGEYEQFDNWPSADISQTTLYLHEKELDGDGDMKTTPYSPWWPKTDTIYSGLDTLASTGIPLISYMTEDYLDLPIISSMPLISTVNAIRWESDWLEEKMYLRGISKIHLNVTPSKSDALLVAYLYDVNWAGIGTLITHAPYTILNATPNETIEIDIDLVATAYDVPQGHYLALVIDTADILYSSPTTDLYKIKVNYENKINNTLTLSNK